MDEATKQAALTAVLVFNLIVIVWMITSSLLSPTPPNMGAWFGRALPAVFVGGGLAGAIFYFMKR
ncbi:MAG: hypothetical protein VB878_14655 [Pirellulaceae bacterium]